MKQALILAIATIGLTATAFAQAPDAGTSPGPHDPNPPMNTPDLRLPPPCAPQPNLAMAGKSATPLGDRMIAPPEGRVVAANSGNDQCSANGVTQSAGLPSPRGAR